MLAKVQESVFEKLKKLSEKIPSDKNIDSKCLKSSKQIFTK